ncbi:MAG: type II toxin-antitoxin system CcdA family antitoxin [Actinobacteria bacterium]|nr:type II toxin-antitoxin system CcdA family antitoxin [Actinomycetota bacterium]
MANRNVTLSLPEDLFKRARIYAAEHDTSVSALVADLLTSRVSVDYARAWAEEERAMHDGVGLSIGRSTPSRDDAHAR